MKEGSNEEEYEETADESHEDDNDDYEKDLSGEDLEFQKRFGKNSNAKTDNKSTAAEEE